MRASFSSLRTRCSAWIFVSPWSPVSASLSSAAMFGFLGMVRELLCEVAIGLRDRRTRVVFEDGFASSDAILGGDRLRDQRVKDFAGVPFLNGRKDGLAVGGL